MAVLLLFQYRVEIFWLPWLELPNLCWIKWWEWASIFCAWSYRKWIPFCFIFNNWERFLLYVCCIWPSLCLGKFLTWPLSKNFYHKWVVNFFQKFCASLEIIMWFLFFNLLIWCITLIDLHIWENPCIPGINPSWSWYTHFLICRCILLARILLRMFYLCPSMILYWPGIFSFFLQCLCLALVAGWLWSCRMS